MIRINLISLLILVPLNSFSQSSFSKFYGNSTNEVGFCVQQSSEGGYIVAGSVYDSNKSAFDIWVVKTDSLGDSLWAKTFGGLNHDVAYSVEQTIEDGYVILGNSESYGSGLGDLWLIKTDSLGDSLWTKTYGGAAYEYASQVHQTFDQGFVLIGGTKTYGAGDSDVWLIKTDSLGDTLWTKTYGGIGSDYGRSIRQTSDSGFVISGHTNSIGNGDLDIWLIKTDQQGDTVFTKTFGGVDREDCYSVQQTQDGGFVISGETSSFGNGSVDAWIIKTNTIGDTLWTKTYGRIDDDYGYDIQQTNDGGFIVTGKKDSKFNGGSFIGNLWLLKLNSSGDSLWSKVYGGINEDIGYSVAQTSDSGYVVCGTTNSYGAGNGDLWLIKTNQFGDTTSVSTTLENYVEFKNEFYLYPNPTRTSLLIRFGDNIIGKGFIEIKNLFGDRLLTSKITEETEHVNVWSLNPGVYFVTLYTSDYQQIGSKKFIKY